MARIFERFLMASRWLLAVFFLGLLVGLLALVVKAGQHALHIAETLLTASESDVILSVLGLVDLTLAASLVLLIIFSGYENFIRAIEAEEGSGWPAWLTTIDFTGLKLKLMASIVSISAVQLLRVFMSAPDRSDRELIAFAGIHLVFVVSGLLLALTDRLTDAGHASGGH